METQPLTASIQDLQKKVVETLQETGKLMGRASNLFTIESEKKKYIQFHNQINEALPSIQNFELRVVIVAPTSAGKSTLVNAMIGRELLPSRTLDMTAYPTEIVFKAELTEPVLTISEATLSLFNEAMETLRIEIVECLGWDNTLEKIADYPLLKNLAEKVKERELIFPQQITGYGEIKQALTEINDFVRLCSKLDSSINQIWRKIKDLPRIETPFIQDEKINITKRLGNLVIIDTPGPNSRENNTEETPEDIRKQLIRKQLNQSSVVLVVLDYTVFNTEVDNQIRTEIKEIVEVIGEDNLYILVNKIDQRKPGDTITSEQLRESIIASFNLNSSDNRNNKVFEVSGRRAFCATNFIQEIKQYSPEAISELKISELKTAKPLAAEVFGMDWQEELEETTVDMLQKKARKLWGKSKFSDFLENTINVLLVKSAPLSLKSSLKRSENRLKNLNNDLICWQSGFNRDFNQIQGEIEFVEGEKKLIETNENVLADKLNKELNDLNDYLDYVLKNWTENIRSSDLDKKISAVGINTKTLECTSEKGSKNYSQTIKQCTEQYFKDLLSEKEKLIKNCISATEEELSKLINQHLRGIQDSVKRVRKRIQTNFLIDLDLTDEWQLPDFSADEIPDGMSNINMGIKPQISIWGQLHNAFVSPLNLLRLDIPIVQEKYSIDVQQYIQEATELMKDNFEERKSEMKQYIKNQLSKEYITNENNVSYSDYINQISTILQQILESKKLSEEPLKELKVKLEFAIKESQELLRQVEDQLIDVEKLID
ncbi:dynamin family protein [Planktothrix agardhii]|jgi:predicted GTPase|uniref:dynamin family protein n=1 Tax=Planktothrix agardhii TaxID=1160 RepID=UPI001D09F8E9|nr:dynamin family protein [Planktothrix agardhii]MCB8787546.1 dynamin family protein [Planktothrix agardhii 1025]MCF3578571.1 dynamin family protein [Planktothrix agardhii 1812]MCF3610682.1 dynamin family protein [Planktothrix agardhii 1027]MCF3644283.1 dynamin family protein [Planktothrix agardhii 1026]CAD5954222.1 Clamp-binding protein CrfC [Planktothrix agardhii]